MAGKPENVNLMSVLAKPERHKEIPESSKWISGEGAGSWFYFDIFLVP